MNYILLFLVVIIFFNDNYKYSCESLKHDKEVNDALIELASQLSQHSTSNVETTRKNINNRKSLENKNIKSESSLLSTEERARATTKTAMSEATAALEKIKAYEDEKGGVYDYAFAEARSGDEAHNIFCKCEPHPSMGKELYAMCPGITEQCKRSFCKPLCLRMAWKPVVSIDCAKAPTWKWCPKYAAQVRAAKKAIESQFQAHVCLDLHFCNETHHMNQWIESHSFGVQYPNPHLPIDGCSRHKNASQEQKELLCAACETVTEVDIIRGECMPQFSTLQPGSLQERCLYLADVISNRKEFLLQIFKDRVCSCLGCCGTGKCFFQNPEEDWLKTLISSVQDRVTAQLESEGWSILQKKPKL